ncbi:hypothetical protein CISIN_1g026914mg [Citrus sinensis]|uniref:Uncharacterized protein n=1 Tax=Citrus sinensis TaxID=2711 RepID=A0A067FD53_CITSI|nr:hypothetical protein CISIN_1g026914mg [Citrus sinensis]
MKSKQIEIRALGQRSITSSFLSRSSNPFKNTKEDVNDELVTKKDSCVSLSDFLDRKLHKSSVLPKTVQGKSCPFLTPVGSRNSAGTTNGQTGVKKVEEKERSNVLDKVVLEQFKHTSKGDDDTCPISSDEIEIPDEYNAKESRKRKHPFEDVQKHTTRKPFVVLGEDSKSKQKGRGESSITNKKSRPCYNHYANGFGWWDSDMEGVDSEAVGYGEAWEGVGSTTFGGIEWH